MSIKSPCKDCFERTVGCHSTCENYISFKKEWDARQEQIRDTKKKEYAYWLSKHERNKISSKFITKTEK